MGWNCAIVRAQKIILFFGGYPMQLSFRAREARAGIQKLWHEIPGSPLRDVPE
jgi:hypothetical protein